MAIFVDGRRFTFCVTEEKRSTDIPARGAVAQILERMNGYRIGSHKFAALRAGRRDIQHEARRDHHHNILSQLTRCLLAAC